MSIQKFLVRAHKCITTPSACFVKHIKTYKRHYLMGILGSFALAKTILLFMGFFGALYHSQYHASAEFVEDICERVRDIPHQECLALKELYYTTQGNQRTQNTNRGISEYACERYGIGCIPVEGGFRVGHVSLPNNNLVGVIPGSIVFLSFLKTLNVSYNNIESIPYQLGNLSNLESIFVSHNNLTTLPSFEEGQFTMLHTLDLSYNEIRNIQPLTIIPQLRFLQLSHNIIDTFPKPIVRSKNNTLTYLDLSYNNLSDDARNYLIDIRSLEYLSLKRNIISTLPSTINSFSNLKTLNIAKNTINTIDAITLLPNLRTLDASYNNIGRIPLFPHKNFLLEELLLAFNNIDILDSGEGRRGTPFYQLLGLHTVNLANNRIPELPEAIKYSSITTFDISYNRLTTSLENLVENILKDMSLQSIYLEGNNLYGIIPVTITQLSSLLPGESSLSYNRLEVDGPSTPTDPTLLSFLNTYFVPSEQHHRNRQFGYIDATISGNILASQPLVSGSGYLLELTLTNIGKRPIGPIEIGLSFSGTMTGIFISGAHWDYWDRTYGVEGDPCFDALVTQTTGIYTTLLNERARTTGSGKRSGFLDYLREERDYIRTRNEQRGYQIGYGLSSYQKEGCQAKGFSRCLRRLFNIDITEYGAQGCGKLPYENPTIISASPYISGIPYQNHLTLTLPIVVTEAVAFSGDLTISLKTTDILKPFEKLPEITLPVAIVEQPVLPPGPVCGNGIIEFKETCDDGNTIDGDGCSNSCKLESNAIGDCGNGIVEPGEECDGTSFLSTTCQSLGYVGGSLACSSTCTLITSGCYASLPTPPSSSPGGGGGGNILFIDQCTAPSTLPCANNNGNLGVGIDYSPSYYDHTCCVGSGHYSASLLSSGSSLSRTSASPKVSNITRLEMAQLIVPFMLTQRQISPTYNNPKCSKFSDIGSLSKTDQNIIRSACQFKVMGMDKYGINPKPVFDPYQRLSWFETVTILSRMLYQDTYNIPLNQHQLPYYIYHLDQITKAGIVKEPRLVTKTFVVNTLESLKTFSYSKNTNTDTSGTGKIIHTSAPLSATSNITTSTPPSISSTIKAWLLEIFSEK